MSLFKIKKNEIESLKGPYFWFLGPYQCPQIGPEFRTLVRIRTFLAKVVRIWSRFCSKVRIFHNNKERTIKILHLISKIIELT